MAKHLQYKDGHLSLNIYELLAGLKDEALATLVDALACHESIIDDVAQQIVGGYTKEGSCGYRGAYTLDSGHALDRARLLIAESSSEVAKQEIARLHRMVESEKKLGAEGWKMYHQATDRQGAH